MAEASSLVLPVIVQTRPFGFGILPKLPVSAYLPHALTIAASAPPRSDSVMLGSSWRCLKSFSICSVEYRSERAGADDDVAARCANRPRRKRQSR